MRCAHTGCTCVVGEGEDFCGEYCRDHSAGAGHEQHSCECGHPGCGAEDQG
jgi:hypothetical protein